MPSMEADIGQTGSRGRGLRCEKERLRGEKRGAHPLGRGAIPRSGGVAGVRFSNWEKYFRTPPMQKIFLRGVRIRTCENEISTPARGAKKPCYIVTLCYSFGHPCEFQV